MARAISVRRYNELAYLASPCLFVGLVALFISFSKSADRSYIFA